MKIKGTFEVSMAPLEHTFNKKSVNITGRMSLDKTFFGELSGTSKGEMLSVRTATPSSAGYVAIEEFEGSLMDKGGGFALQHFGIMVGGESRLILEVVPDSGTKKLKNLSGKMKIENKDGLHHYEFDFEW